MASRNILGDLEWKRARELVIFIDTDGIFDQKIVSVRGRRVAGMVRCRRFQIALSPQKRLQPESIAHIFSLILQGDVVQFPPRFSNVP